MGNTLIKVNCVDQRLITSNNPLIAAGGRNEDRMEFTFCSLWEGFEKTAVFYRDANKAVYHIPIEDDACIIPHEVLADEGWMYFGVFGTLNDVRRTTAIAKYRIERGAITGYGLPSDPTSDIYAQYLAQVLRAETAASNAETAASNANNAAERADNAASNAETAASNSVRYDIAQTLTDEQKTQARENIGAADAESIIGLKDDFEDINITKTVGKNILNFDDIENGNFSSSGALIDSASYSRTRNIIPVVEGETYTLQSGTNIPLKIKMRWVFAYNNNGEIVDSKQFAETYTVPIGQGVVGIKISIDNKYANESAGTMLSKGTEIGQYEPYREIKYVDCGIKIKNAIDYDIIDDMEKDLKRSHHDFRYMDTVCSEYSCASPYIANPGHQSVNAVYDMYDELMNQYPDYITKTLIGTIDDYGYEVYRYDFTPPVPISSTESDVCKILYCTGTHGEYPNIWVGVRFLKDLCDNWRSDKMLQCIRFGCHITAIPLVNPYGFVNNSRKNENGIDINRNFTTDWIFKTDDVNSVEYQGLAPASEKSTQIIEALCAGEKFDFGIDHHIYGSFDGSGMLGYFVNCLKKPENVSFANMYGLWANQKCMAENTLISDFSTSYFKTFTQKYSFDGYLYGTFENGILWESMTGWGNDEMEAVVESQKFNAECLAALIYSAMKHYRRY